MCWTLNYNVEAAAAVRPGGISPQRRDRLGVAADGAARLRSREFVLLCESIAVRKSLAGQRELHAAGGAEPRVLERTLKLGSVADEQAQRFGTIDYEPRTDGSQAIDIELHIDASEFGRIKADFKPFFPRLRLHGDRYRDLA